ncbi:2-amino-4-hydroxy-6-hydroxymethyldihydropteridine diphosphokinase [Fredinandcohnia quinoae]|uniref:2-amino-4-hydroxy-6-hydroxymethyldihydropteridine diphosphokinase n=1 Tax=Fredinandcohnia quinoae TaxID=2918902 RepID=A0AAW5E1X3_9BACI|nr:2-amino-4-hydroxy-6-hydroxymethyldihydropteridine diphosphokinase [Fredinandcohnia sp. SECRCQ15]MCH1626910.1 2-amino-4-hydroxy-6-hydroxymethyldihydropteridine diphosphokinase [Fredinandcohnia sp. SECRCQ15]
MENIAYIGIGSNLGDRSHYLFSAIKSIQEHQEIEIASFSSIYETVPIGYEDDTQDHYLNMVIKVKTNLSAVDLLRVLQRIELDFGRERKIRWGPRTLDLDILLYNHENIVTEDLIIPHPRMTQRAFVMLPLIEVDKEIKIPLVEIPLSVLLDELQDREGVREWKRKSGEDVFELFES